MIVTLAAMKLWVGVPPDDIDQDANLTAALAAADSSVAIWCQRNFELAGSVSARRFAPPPGTDLTVDDFGSLAGLIVATDDNDDGIAETTWAASTYEVIDPPAGVGLVEPWTTIRALDRAWPWSARRSRPIQVTALWGWAEVPATATIAVKLIAHNLWKQKDAPGGVVGIEFGGIRISSQLYQRVADLIGPLRRAEAFGIA